jgi:hypothetical protein
MRINRTSYPGALHYGLCFCFRPDRYCEERWHNRFASSSECRADCLYFQSSRRRACGDGLSNDRRSEQDDRSQPQGLHGELPHKLSVDQSTRVHAGAGSDNEYGYGLWIRSGAGLYEALGRGGQRISVVPSKNMIVVFTGGGFDPEKLESFF